MRATAALIFVVAMLAGCAGPRSLVPGQSTEADVRSTLGAPKDTRTEPNGDLVWEYPTGPEGFFTYAVRMGPDKRVKVVTQLVSEEQLAKIMVGKTTQAEVTQLLGRPARQERLQIGESWYWRFIRNGISTGYLIVTFNSASITTSKIAIMDAYPGAQH